MERHPECAYAEEKSRKDRKQQGHMQTKEKGSREPTSPSSLIPRFQPPELWRNKCLMLRLPSLWFVVMATREDGYKGETGSQHGGAFVKHSGLCLTWEPLTGFNLLELEIVHQWGPSGWDVKNSPDKARVDADSSRNGRPSQGASPNMGLSRNKVERALWERKLFESACQERCPPSNMAQGGWIAFIDKNVQQWWSPIFSPVLSKHPRNRGGESNGQGGARRKRKWELIGSFKWRIRGPCPATQDRASWLPSILFLCVVST